jgi:hypothetical protein
VVKSKVDYERLIRTPSILSARSHSRLSPPATPSPSGFARTIWRVVPSCWHELLCEEVILPFIVLHYVLTLVIFLS